MSETYIFGNVGDNKGQIGTNTMLMTTGMGNTAYGFAVFTELTSGTNNSGFGVDIASGIGANPSNCTAFGTRSIQDATTAMNVSSFGYQSMLNTTSASNGTGFGANVGDTMTTGANNTIFGAGADVVNTSVTNSVAIGSNAITADQSIVVGAEARCLDTSVGSDCIVIGAYSTMGDGSLQSLIVGANSGNEGPMTTSVVVGESSTADPMVMFSNSLMIGWFSGFQSRDSVDNTAVGEDAGGHSNGARNTAIGYDSMAFASSDGMKYDNTCVGYASGNNIETGSQNTLLGLRAGTAFIAGNGNTAVGTNTMYNVAGASTSSAVSGITSALSGVGGFSTTTSFSTNFVRVENVLYGTTNDIAPGTAAAGGAGELFAVAKARDGSVSTTEISFIDVNGATTAGLDGKYFLISSTVTDYYVWFDIDNSSADPGPPGLNLPALIGKTGIEVNLTSGATVGSITSTIRSAIRGVDGNDKVFLANIGSSTNIRVSGTINGDVTDIAPGTAVGSDKLISVTKLRDGTGGTPEVSLIDVTNASLDTLNGTYFLISNTVTDYYVWFNDGTAIDPAVGGRTGVEVTYTLADNNTAIGWQAMIGNFGTLPVQNFKDNVSIGYEAGAYLDSGGDRNTFIGAHSASTAASSVSTGTDNLLIGQGSNATTIDSETVGIGDSVALENMGTVIGQGSSTAVGALEGIAIGMGAIATAAADCQIGNNVVSGAATLNFRTQVVADESWIGGGSSTVIIDNNGNIVRGTGSLLEEMTTDDTTTVMETYIMADNTSRQIEALVMGRKTGGSAGVSDHIYSVRLDAVAVRTGGSLGINNVTEVQLTDAVNSFPITNTVVGYTLDIAAGTAVGGAPQLLNVSTLVDGVTAPRKEVSLVDFYNYSFPSVASIYGRYFLISSTTVNYYVWWSSGATTDPITLYSELTGMTGIEVVLTGTESPLSLIQKTATAVEAVGGIGTTFSSPVYPNSTIVEIIHDDNMADTGNISPGTAASGGVGELNAVYTTRDGDSTYNERSIVDTFGSTPAGLDGKWFLLYGTLNYYAWYRVDGVTTDPGPAGTNIARLVGKTGIMIDILTGDSDVVIASKTASAIDSVPVFTDKGNGIVIVNNVTGAPIAPIDYETTFINPLLGTGRIRYYVEHVPGSVGVSQEVVLSTAGALGTGLDPQFNSAVWRPGAWFQISTTATTYYFWYRVTDSPNGANTDPAPGGTGVMIDILTTDGEVEIAAKTITAINGTGVFTASSYHETLAITNTVAGPATNVSEGANGNSVVAGLINQLATIAEGTSTAVAEVSVVDSSGATPAGLDGTYFLLSSPTTDYYIWYNVDGGSVDPALSGTTGVPVALVTLPSADTDADIATKTAAAINGIGGAGVTFTSAVQSPWSATIAANGTNAELQITGGLGYDITWKAYTRNIVV